MILNPSPEQENDFFQKVFPVLEKAIAAEGFTVKRGNVISRGLNLAMGLVPKTKAERHFQGVLLRMIAQEHPGNEYPDLCPPPPEVDQPDLKLVEGGVT